MNRDKEVERIVNRVAPNQARATTQPEEIEVCSNSSRSCVAIFVDFRGATAAMPLTSPSGMRLNVDIVHKIVAPDVSSTAGAIVRVGDRSGEVTMEFVVLNEHKLT